jgi:hypothetical protein
VYVRENVTARISLLAQQLSLFWPQFDNPAPPGAQFGFTHVAASHVPLEEQAVLFGSELHEAVATLGWQL